MRGNSFGGGPAADAGQLRETSSSGTTCIDLNADLGEGFGQWSMGDDEALLRVVSSANVACGFHAGDPNIMRRMCAHAAALGVTIGAHVGYRDLAGFGRRDLAVPAGELRNEIVYQVAALDGLARAEGTRVCYVKAHGALYHRAAYERDAAEALVNAVRDLGTGLDVLGPPRSVLSEVCRGVGAQFRGEGFADRGYLDDGTLAHRSQPHAIKESVDEAAAQAVSLATQQQVTSITGGSALVTADSICVHGDTANAVATARRVRTALTEAGVRIAAFA